MALGAATLKGRDTHDPGGTGREARAEEPNSERRITFRIARLGRKVQKEQLVILRGFVRAAGGKLETFSTRAMLDSGAEANFIAPSLVRRIGARMDRGDFGVAVQAFGAEAPIKGEIPDLQVFVRGTQAASGLAQEFKGETGVLVAPCELSNSYDLLLGRPFMSAHEMGMVHHKHGGATIVLTARDGTKTTVEVEAEDARDEEREEEFGDRWTASAAQRADRAPRKPLTSSQKRACMREWRRYGEEDGNMARRAAKEAPHLVMSMEELEELVRSAPPNTVTVTPILSCGFQETRSAPTERISISQITARGAAAAKGAADGATEESESNQGHLPARERARAEALVDRITKDYPDVFTAELPPLSAQRVDPDGKGVQIVLKEGAQPSGRYGPRMTHEDTEEAGKMIKELLEKGFIRPSRSPWGAPMFLVSKPDGGKRMVIDYRALNASTVRNRYPLPRVDELFDQLQGARYFSKIDLRTGYWQIRMAADAVEKTAFTSRHGHFEWLVLPMGLTNAPAEFMALMERTFEAELNKFILVFLDDILIYSKTLAEHESHLRAALDRLRAQGLHAKISKCSFFRQEVEFLGHYVGRAGVRMVEGKVEAVRAWPTPTKQKDVEQFIGLAGYYRRFIANFSKIASPLTELCGTLKKARGGAQKRDPPKKEFKWGEEQQSAFERLKEAVSGAPCLAMPDPAREFIVHTDASGYATGAVLMQQFDDGLRPIAFLSKKMKPAERNYPIYEQELLAILNALRAWRHYLGGRHFTVWTDHQSLQYVESSAMATPRQVRWATWLSEFDFSIKYAPGDKNVVADGLSRAAAGGAPEADTEEIDEERLLIGALSEMAPIPVRVRQAAADDANYQIILARDDEYLSARKLGKARGLLYRNLGVPNGGQLVVPENAGLRAWMLGWAHDALEGGHRGGARMHEWLKSRVWWPKMAEDAQRYANGCEMCQRGKPDQRGRQGLPLSIATPERAGDIICMDFVGPFPRAAGGYTHALVIIDKLTRYVVYVPLGENATAQQVFGALDQRWLAMFGVPRAIISDRDTRFTSHFWEDLWEGFRTELKRSTAFHPQTDGSTERANRVLVEALRAYVNARGDNWATLLPQLQRATNASVCASTGYTPDFMMFGREMRSGLDADLEADGVAARGRYPGAQQIHEQRAKAEADAREQIEKAQAKQRADAAKGRRAPDIKVGDKVWLSNRNLRNVGAQRGARKLEPLYYGPYAVVEMRGTNAARLQLPDGCLLHPVFNLDLLKKFVDGAQEFPDRPAHFDRQGPVPEEDPAAGGPQAGDPVYEVEAVIARRGTGARKEYRVLWKGWPAETASWIGKDNWDGMEEAIAEFEARGVGVSALRQRRRQPRKPETAATRAEAIKATKENVPKAADRPPVVNGQIDMGAQRCTASTKAGGWCKARTKYGCMCWVHRAAVDGTAIKESTIPGAGKGLFATRDFPNKAVIARYTGDLLNTQDGEDSEDGFEGSEYVLELSQLVSIDAARTDTADGRLINDIHRTRLKPNVRFVPFHAQRTVTIKTTRAVKAGEEFLLSYGRSFWDARKRGAAEAKRAKEIVAEEAAAAAPARAPAAARAARGGTREDPIVLAPTARRYHLNMIGRGSARGRDVPGTWIDAAHWICDCHVHSAWGNRRNATMPDCAVCGRARPDTPSPETSNGEYGSFSPQSFADRRAQSARATQAQAERSAQGTSMQWQGLGSARARNSPPTGGAAAAAAGGAAARSAAAARARRDLEERKGDAEGAAAAAAAGAGSAYAAVAQADAAAAGAQQQGAAAAAAGAQQGSAAAAAAETPEARLARWKEMLRREEEGEGLDEEQRARQAAGGNYYFGEARGDEEDDERAQDRDAADVDREERMAEWRAAPPENQSLRANRGDGPQGTIAGKRENDWPIDADDKDCRGVASVLYPAQIRWRVPRVPILRKGYCRRNTCQCCSPTGATGHFCSCKARKDGFCRRCWLDYWVDLYVKVGHYWGP